VLAACSLRETPIYIALAEPSAGNGMNCAAVHALTVLSTPNNTHDGFG
jgi:hypothetical protein